MSTEPNGTIPQGDANQQYEQLVASINGIIWEVDTQTFQFTFVSQQAERLLGYPLQQWFQPGFWADHLHPDDRNGAMEVYQRATSEKRNRDFTYRMIAADGRIVWLRDIVSVVVEGDEATRLRGIMVDITEQKRDEEALRASEELYRFLMANTSDLITLYDVEGHRVYANPSVVRVVGQVPAVTMGGVHPEDLQATRQVWQRVLAGEKTYITYRHAHADGSWRWLEAWGSLVQYQGKPHVMAVTRDITERKRSEQEHERLFAQLEQEREQAEARAAELDTLFAAMTNGIILYAPDGTIIRANEAAERLFNDTGAPTNLPLAQRVALFKPTWENGQPVTNFDDLPAPRALRGETVHDVVLGLRSIQTGQIIWLAITAAPVRDVDGHLRGALLTFNDITERKQTESALHASAEWLRLAAHASNIGLWDWDLQTNQVNFSREWKSQLGYAEHEIGADYSEWERRLHPDDLAPTLAALQAYFDGRHPEYAVEFRLRHKDGSWRWIYVRGEVFRANEGKPGRMLGCHVDITERKEAEAALRASEGRLEEAERIAHVGYWERDFDAGRATHSDESYRIFGLSPEERLLDLAHWQERWQELIHPEDRLRAVQAMADALAGGPRYDVEYRVVHPNGEVRFIHGRGDVSWDEAGRPRRVFGTVQDITERKRAEEALRESEARFRTFVDHATDAFFLHDDRGQILDVNRQACKSLGYTREELVGMTPIDFDADVDPSRIVHLSARLDAGEVMTFETHHRRKDGSTFPVEVRIRPFWQGGRRFGFSLAQDITARKRAEKLQHAVYRIAEAANSVKSLDDLFRAVHEIIQGVMPADNFYIALYDERENLLSFPYFVDEVDVSSLPQKPGKGLTEYVLHTGQSLLCDAGLHEELIRRGEAELNGVPSPIWLGVPLKIEDKTIGVMAVQHYTDERAYGEREKEILEYVSSQVAKAIERKRAERDLVESHSLVNAVVEGTSDAVFVKDLQGRYLMINTAGARLLGKTVAEVIGKDDWKLFTPDTASALIESERQVMAAGESQVLEERATAAGVTRIYLSTKSVYRDAQGRVIGLIGISRDVTELKRLEEQFRQAQKMEAVGRLAGGVAHDFNNLLTVINGYSGLIFNRLRAEDPSRKPLVEIQKAGERAANLTRQLLAVSRKQVLQPQVVSFNTLLGELLKLLQRLLGEDIELTLVPDASLGLAKVDPGQFEQAMINLAVNARDAMPQGGQLTIETHNTELDEDYAEHHQEVRAGHYVLVAVSDSGHGMDEVTKARIFEPFFTTKGPGQGTGLGLAMVYGFVKQSGGHIEVYSELGHGTTFKVYLPRTEETIPSAKPPPDLPKIPQGNETVLLVEDEDAVRTLSRHVLQSNGYTVLEARDGQEAIQVAQQHQGLIHLLVTDVVMPRMSGRQLADLLAQARPYLRILFMSGYTDEAVLRHGVLEASVAFLQKPFSSIELVRKVREVLDAEKSRFR